VQGGGKLAFLRLMVTMGHFPEATEYSWGVLEAQLGCICGEFGLNRVGWSTYGDRVIEWIETATWHKLKL
jgi:hypothetical protein